MDEDQRSEETPKEDGGTASTPTVQDNQPRPIQNQADNQYGQREHFHCGLTQYQFISTIIQGSIFAAAFIYMIFAGLQWYAMRETLNLTHENIALTKQTVRAWLVTTKIERTSDFVSNSPITFTVKFKNVGPSTALSVTFGTAVWTCNGPPSLSCASQCPPQLSTDPRAGESMVGPQAETFLEISFPPLTQRSFDAIKNGTQTAYFCGSIGYKDVFDVPHTLNICDYYMPDLDKFG